MELKTCPFCGGEGVRSKFRDDDGVEHVGSDIHCGHADCAGWEIGCNAKEWNTRAPDRAAYERCAEIAGGFRDDRFDGSALEDRGDSYRNQQIAAAIRAELATLEGEGKP